MAHHFIIVTVRNVGVLFVFSSVLLLLLRRVILLLLRLWLLVLLLLWLWLMVLLPHRPWLIPQLCIAAKGLLHLIREAAVAGVCLGLGLTAGVEV